MCVSKLDQQAGKTVNGIERARVGPPPIGGAEAMNDDPH